MIFTNVHKWKWLVITNLKLLITVTMNLFQGLCFTFLRGLKASGKPVLIEIENGKLKFEIIYLTSY